MRVIVSEGLGTFPKEEYIVGSLDAAPLTFVWPVLNELSWDILLTLGNA